MVPVSSLVVLLSRLSTSFVVGIFIIYYFLPKYYYYGFTAASIVEPLGFSGSLSVMFFLHCILCDTILANKDVLFCSFLLTLLLYGKLLGSGSVVPF